MKNEIKIIEGVYIDSLNPINCALKNQYWTNTFCTAILVLPRVAKMIPEGIVVTKAFLPGSRLREEYSAGYTSEIERFSRGLAIEVTWSGWNVDDALQVAYNIYSDCLEMPDEKMKIIIDEERQRLYVGRDFKVTEILEKTAHGERVIRKED